MKFSTGSKSQPSAFDDWAFQSKDAIIHEFAPAYYLLASGICLHGDVINLSLGLLSLHWSIKS